MSFSDYKGAVRCKSCGGFLLLPLCERTEDEGNQLRSAYFDSSLKDEDLVYVHPDYRPFVGKDVEIRLAQDDLWALCNECCETTLRNKKEKEKRKKK